MKRITSLDGLYAHIETEFIRGFQFLSLPLGARMLYLSIWCYALSQRREKIVRPPNDFLSRMAGLQRHPITTYLQRLHDCQLLTLDTNTIIVKGLKQKHNKIIFKDGVENSQDDSRNPENPSFLSYPSLSIPFRSTPPTPLDRGASATPPKRRAAVKKSPLIEPEKFEQFWKAYPRRIGKGAAEKSWTSALKNSADPNTLILSAQKFAVLKKGEDPKFIPHPSTWLNQRRWEDQPDPKPEPPNDGPRSRPFTELKGSP